MHDTWPFFLVSKHWTNHDCLLTYSSTLQLQVAICRNCYSKVAKIKWDNGGFSGANSDGYSELEFENIYGTTDWYDLGRLLTKEVRCFSGHVDKSLPLPQLLIDPQHQKLPPVQTSFSRWFLENISFDHKRKSSNEDESEKKKLSENGISDSGHAFSLSDGVKQPLKLVALNGGSLMYPNSVSSSRSSPTVEKNSSK